MPSRQVMAGSPLSRPKFLDKRLPKPHHLPREGTNSCRKLITVLLATAIGQVCSATSHARLLDQFRRFVLAQLSWSRSFL